MTKQQMATAAQQAATRPLNGQEAMSGRRTPEPALASGDMGEQDIQQLMRDYKELRKPACVSAPNAILTNDFVK